MPNDTILLNNTCILGSIQYNIPQLTIAARGPLVSFTSINTLIPACLFITCYIILLYITSRVLYSQGVI